MADPAIPTVDLLHLHGTSSEQREALEAIRVGYGHYGLVYVKNHLVSDVAGLYDRFQAFCDRPSSDKQTYNRQDLWYQRGWTPPNTEKAVVAGGQPDFKECWFATPTEIPKDLQVQFPEIFADNVWPDGEENAGGKLAEDYTSRGRELHEAGLALLRGAAKAAVYPQS